MGLAGSLYSMYIQFAHIHNVHFETSGNIVMMVLIGGMGTLFGPIVGAFLIVSGSDIASALWDRWLFIMGLLFIFFVLFALFFALPRPFSRRQMERLFMGWSLLYLSQTLNLVFHVEFFYATGFGELNAAGVGEWSTERYSDLARDVYGLLRHFTDLVRRPEREAWPAEDGCAQAAALECAVRSAEEHGALRDV